MAKLKPCPFCGGKPKIKFYNRDMTIRKYDVGCNQTLCPVRPVTRTFESADEAIEAWNGRAVEST